MAKQTNISFTSDDKLSNVTADNNKFQDNHQLNESLSLNDVVAFKNESSYFKIGKIQEINEKCLKLNLFQYKLDVRTEHIVQEDILLKLGNLGSKTLFELSNEKQKLLIDSIFNTYENFTSNLHLIKTIQEKENNILEMEKQIVGLFENLILSNDYVELINEFINMKTIDVDYLLHFILEHIDRIEHEDKLEYLVDFIGCTYFKKRTLTNLQHEIDSINNIHSNSLQKVKFIGKVLQKINQLVTQTDAVQLDVSFVLYMASLLMKVVSWYSSQ